MSASSNASAPASTSTSTTLVASGGAGGGAGASASAGATAEAGATAAATAMNRVLPHLRLAAASAASGGSAAAAAATTTASALEAAQKYMKSVKTLLVDCDGVLWRGSDPIPGSAEAVEALRSAGKRVMFVVQWQQCATSSLQRHQLTHHIPVPCPAPQTNNSTKSRAMYVKKLASGGITATADDIMRYDHCQCVCVSSTRTVFTALVIVAPHLQHIVWHSSLPEEHSQDPCRLQNVQYTSPPCPFVNT